MLQKLCYSEPDPGAGTGAGQDWTGSTTLEAGIHDVWGVQVPVALANRDGGGLEFLQILMPKKLRSNCFLVPLK